MKEICAGTAPLIMLFGTKLETKISTKTSIIDIYSMSNLHFFGVKKGQNLMVGVTLKGLIKDNWVVA